MGVCAYCGKAFISRIAGKKFCNLACYTRSPEFKERQRRMSAEALFKRIGNLAAKRGDRPPSFSEAHTVSVPCTNCGAETIKKLSGLKQRNVFCGRKCYREFLAKRFDRWIASPQGIALPQNYDEFLTGDDLPCLVDGCTWRGRSLGFHVNMAHGVSAAEFKRMAGFNKGTGLITADIAEAFAARQRELLEHRPDIVQAFLDSPRGESVAAKSAEAQEHRAKARALIEAVYPKKHGTCLRCGREFPFGPLGWRIYCSKACRHLYYKDRAAERVYDLVCSWCRQGFKGTRNQALRAGRGEPVACCRMHKGLLNSIPRRRDRSALPTWLQENVGPAA